MVLLPLAFAIIAHQDQPSVYTLAIGSPGTVTVESGRLTRVATGQSCTADDVARAADGKRFVFLGEEHATPPDQQMHADVIEALARRGRQVVIGMEMYQRPKQPFLDQFTSGHLAEADFLSLSDWKTQWGMPFAFYRPVFDAACRHQFPILGLNIPRDWVHAVGQKGFAGLSDDARKQLPPDMSLTNSSHREVFDALMGGHPGMSGAMMENVYAAQVLWDEAMADTLAKYVAANPPGLKTVYVVISGSGHMLYGQGINFRLAKRGYRDQVNVAMLQSQDAIQVSKGIADFVYVTPKQAE